MSSEVLHLTIVAKNRQEAVDSVRDQAMDYFAPLWDGFHVHADGVSVERNADRRVGDAGETTFHYVTKFACWVDDCAVGQPNDRVRSLIRDEARNAEEVSGPDARAVPVSELEEFAEVLHTLGSEAAAESNGEAWSSGYAAAMTSARLLLRRVTHGTDAQ